MMVRSVRYHIFSFDAISMPANHTYISRLFCSGSQGRQNSFEFKLLLLLFSMGRQKVIWFLVA